MIATHYEIVRFDRPYSSDYFQVCMKLGRDVVAWLGHGQVWLTPSQAHVAQYSRFGSWGRANTAMLEIATTNSTGVL